MVDPQDNPGNVTVSVTISTQQRPVIERVRSTGRMGATDGEVLRRVFLDWVAKKMEHVEPLSVIGADRDSSGTVP
jgi:hypothetical protein